MAKAKRSPDRREEALSRERIVGEAIVLLDAEGEGGLTFRALAARLATGAGAIYWHVASKDELLVAATEAVLTSAMGKRHASAKPGDAIRTIALGVYEAIDVHPWVGAQLSRPQADAATRLVFERLGRQIQALGVRGRAQFTAASSLLSYIVGVSTQNAANGRAFEPSVDRAAFLEGVAARWKALDAREYPFLHSVADRLPTHDDRAEFLAGIDLILAGITASL